MPPTSTARVRFQNDPSDPRHGTTNGYINFLCRCDGCKAAQAEYMQGPTGWRSRRAKGLPDPDDPRHGTYNGYCNWGCRCRPCKDAGRDRARARRKAARQ